MKIVCNHRFNKSFNSKSQKVNVFIYILGRLMKAGKYNQDEHSSPNKKAYNSHLKNSNINYTVELLVHVYESNTPKWLA